MKITIETIDHNDQRYDTIGDWVFDNKDNLNIKVSNFNNKDFFFLVAVHELVEAYLCNKVGITQDEVDEFDFHFNKLHPYEEPGENKDAPYHRQHIIANVIEGILLRELKINENVYELTIDKLVKSYGKDE
jgi:hypothetical protein